MSDGPLNRQQIQERLLDSPFNAFLALEVVTADPTKAEAERFAPSYGHAPSAWDPEGATRTVLVLKPRRIVTLG